MKYKKKLIEVALPLEAINVASAREKSIRHGHPSTLHLWWARRPLATARAVIFAQMVDDPSAHPDIFKTEKAQEKERQRLFRIIEELVKWENTTNEVVLQQARDEIWQSWRYTCAENADHPRAKELFDRFKLPGFHDPFAGGGTLPLEAQRLGLESYASDLNPIPVIINKAAIEIPPKFLGKSPVNPETNRDFDLVGREWSGVQGLAEDIRYYGRWMREKAEKSIGHLYPPVEITPNIVRERPDLQVYLGRKLNIIAWLWARTVKSPNPAFSNIDVPLITSFILSTKVGKEVYLEPVIEVDNYKFIINVGKSDDAEIAKNGTKLARGANFKCIMSGTPIAGDYIKTEGKAGRMGVRLLAMVAEGDRGRVYLAATKEQELTAQLAVPGWRPEVEISGSTQYLGVKPYGLERFDQIFTDRQLVALTTFSDLIDKAKEQVRLDSIVTGLLDDAIHLRDGGKGVTAYSEAVAIYLAFGVSKATDMCNALCAWGPTDCRVRHLFSRQALPMVWDFAETSPLNDSAGAVYFGIQYLTKALELFNPSGGGFASQASAQTQSISAGKVVSTDPPYYDNVPYADLSDFFYIWLRRSLYQVFPDLFSTMAVPKAEELVAFAYRHINGKVGAEAFFLDGMTQAMQRIAEQSHPAFPVTIYYAFKQSESDENSGIASTGWETFLDSVIRAGFSTTGTWPIRTELANRTRGMASNALASSIVIVCRKRAENATTATRREFVTVLKTELPEALRHLQAGNIAPVDLAQAAIGPGMAVYTRYAKVLDAEGKPLSVRAALTLINQTLDETLAEQEGDFDEDTRWALTWFEQVGFAEGDFGIATVLAQAKATGMDGLVKAGIIVSGKGKVRLLKPAELPTDWDPATDTRLTVWEMVHHLIRVLEADGESAAAVIVVKLGNQAEIARELCYRLYTLCERKKRANEAMPYNGLVQSWPEITRLASETPRAKPSGTDDMFNQG
jgi:putative DNA methylase